MMKTVSAILFAAIGSLMLAAPDTAAAADTLLATCKGDGADFHLADVSEEDASIVYGLSSAPGEDAVLVVDSDGGNAHWSTASRSDIDRDCGGDGDDEITLFEPVQPRDGLWRSRLTDHRMSGCPSMLATRVKAMLPDIMEKEGAEQRTFDKPFHPRGLMHDSERVHWVQVGPDRWRGVLAMENSSKAGMSMSVEVTLHVVSPTRMDGANTVTIDMPPRLAMMMGGGSGHCQSIARARMTWSE